MDNKRTLELTLEGGNENWRSVKEKRNEVQHLEGGYENWR